MHVRERAFLTCWKIGSFPYFHIDLFFESSLFPWLLYINRAYGSVVTVSTDCTLKINQNKNSLLAYPDYVRSEFGSLALAINNAPFSKMSVNNTPKPPLAEIANNQTALVTRESIVTCN